MNVVNKELLKKIYNELKLKPKVSQIELAKKYGVNERTIRRYYKILKDNGFIIQYSSGRKTTWLILKK